MLEYLQELEARLDKAAHTLEELAHVTVSPNERDRIYGKKSGVALASSYVREKIRELKGDTLA